MCYLFPKLDLIYNSGNLIYASIDRFIVRMHTRKVHKMAYYINYILIFYYVKYKLRDTQSLRLSRKFNSDNFKKISSKQK